MRFQITAQGRTVFLTEDEKACRGCGAQESYCDKWYYLDDPFSKGLYCRDCARVDDGSVRSNPSGKPFQFWEVDSFRLGKEQEEIK
ncbi:hypothetical protein DRH27_04220 [Candidatus Falkowbacteria bacterium]|nr:MAG: hypothetical protein DRH27_04220 [Candidatus Falkowbacteria bacterium]